VHPQPTTPPPIASTPAATILMVNSQPLRTYLRGRDLELIFELIGEVDGHRVTYTPGRHLRRCARHGRRPDCPCLERLAALAGPIDLRAWWKTLAGGNAAGSCRPPTSPSPSSPASPCGPSGGSRPAGPGASAAASSSPPPSSASCSCSPHSSTGSRPATALGRPRSGANRPRVGPPTPT
jgi:hypothetical protein